MRRFLAAALRCQVSGSKRGSVLPVAAPALVRAALVLVLFSTLNVMAQDEQPKNEVAIGVGRTFISDQTVPNTNFFDNTVHSGKGLSLNFLYARQLKFFKWADSALAVELPVIYNPDEDLIY